MAFNQDQEMEWWKNEPVSPNGVPSLEVDDYWLLFDDKSLEFWDNAAENIKFDDGLNRTEVAKKTLEEMEMDEWIKEEPFSVWLEQKTCIPIFEDLSLAPDDNSQNNETGYHPHVLKPTTQQQQPLPQQQQYHTQSLLEEFETVLEDVEACHQVISPTTQQSESLTGSSALTPPESPQQDIDTQLLITLQPLSPETVQQSSLFPSNESEVVYNTITSVENPLYVNNTARQWDTVGNISLDSLDREVVNDLAEVDEYVRSHTKDISAPSSPCNSSGSSYTSVEDAINDPDWNMKSGKKNSKPATSRNHQKLYRQYFRPSIEDKKVRKKEQNKNAATRYRQKKKQEIIDIEGEELQLTETNEKLKNQVTEVKREIKYLKGLLRELYKAKGVLH